MLDPKKEQQVLKPFIATLDDTQISLFFKVLLAIDESMKETAAQSIEMFGESWIAGSEKTIKEKQEAGVEVSRDAIEETFALAKYVKAAAEDYANALRVGPFAGYHSPNFGEDNYEIHSK